MAEDPPVVVTVRTAGVELQGSAMTENAMASKAAGVSVVALVEGGAGDGDKTATGRGPMVEGGASLARREVQVP